ncbi:toll/interleukin-1 receptor domain-containing protein [Streptomyces sp. HD1123-B1]|uniref:toll/interleukin-1 receptor domain-containing protein n=1 Tax=Streptomyces huangiella TaxID=3228804 RepID=UPI003D7F0D6B
MPDVFINYRTHDGEKTATTIERELSHRFGSERIFRASKSIRPGEPFPQALINGVRRSGVLLAVMGPDWAGSPRLHDEQDWVRREIEEAYTCAIPVVPLLDGRRTERLRTADLPAALAWLADCQSLRFDHQNASADLRTIGDALADLVPALREAGERTARTPEPGTVHNGVGEVNGAGTQSRDITGDVGTVIKGAQGPVHTGRGDIHQHTPTITGDGAAYVAGNNHGGISHTFGGPRRREGDER